MSWGLRGLLLGMTALLGIGRDVAYAIEDAPMFDAGDFIVLGGGKRRYHSSTPGGRAHKRWKRARASGISPRVRHG